MLVGSVYHAILARQPITEELQISPGILTGLTQPSPEALRAAIRETRSLLKKPNTPLFVPLHLS